MNVEINHLENDIIRIRNYMLKSLLIFRWVAEITHEKIKNIISEPLPPYTRAIMASALYFKALWERSFIDKVTRPYVFIHGKRNSFTQVVKRCE